MLLLLLLLLVWLVCICEICCFADDFLCPTSFLFCWFCCVLWHRLFSMSIVVMIVSTVWISVSCDVIYFWLGLWQDVYFRPPQLFKTSLGDSRGWTEGVVRCGRRARASLDLFQRRVIRGCRLLSFVLRDVVFQLSLVCGCDRGADRGCSSTRLSLCLIVWNF